MNQSSSADQSDAVATPRPGQLRACDPRRLARNRECWRGSIAVEELERFASVTVGAEQAVQWTAAFSEEAQQDDSRMAWLTLSFSVQVEVPCGRCAEPLALSIDEDRLFSFATDEDEASLLDEQAADYDVLVAAPSFDLLDLIEDELIMAIPLIVQHESCPSAGQDGGGAPADATQAQGRVEPETQRPFADLAKQIKSAGQEPVKSGNRANGEDSDSPSGPATKGTGRR